MQALNARALRLAALAAAAAAALGLAACSRQSEPTVGQKIDSAIAEARQSGEQVADSMKAGASDAAITAKVNAALAADDKLSAVQIDVDTASGRVTLNGTAPDAASRDRASVLAAAVEGVTSVDNRLTVKGS